MAHSKLFQQAQAISMPEYVDWLDTEVDVWDPQSLWASADKLHQLSCNKMLFDDVLFAPLKELAVGSQTANPYADGTFLLSSIDKGKRYFVRANIWIPPRMRAGTTEWEIKHYSYLYPHDHNFDFLTAGYFGPGYRTEVFEYDSKQVSGFVGEKVEITPLEDTHLTQNKVMYFRKSTDLHIQYPPESLSISLNLMVRNFDELATPAYSFDVQAGKITAAIQTPMTRRASVIDLAVELCGVDVADVLKDVAIKHESQQLRRAAFSGMLRLLPDDHEHIGSMIAKDRSPYVTELIDP